MDTIQTVAFIALTLIVGWVVYRVSVIEDYLAVLKQHLSFGGQ